MFAHETSYIMVCNLRKKDGRTEQTKLGFAHFMRNSNHFSRDHEMMDRLLLIIKMNNKLSNINSSGVARNF
jgi:hypothetical protein